MFIKICIAATLVLQYARADLSPFIVGGDNADIGTYPHAVFLDIYLDVPAICGGSILNQAFVLTAAHCLEDYRQRQNHKVVIQYGSSSIKQLYKVSMKTFKIHENYNTVTLFSDIALILANRRMRLGYKARRAVIFKNAPKYPKLAFVAGWGITSKFLDQPTVLKFTKQQIRDPVVCSKMGAIEEGTFCAGPEVGLGHPDLGDSGSALMINNFVQIGIVSYKVQEWSLVVYTNVTHYHNWIARNTQRMFCLS